nr:MAG TPA: hypothetical protein [Caudoviricetes sp.]
MDYYLFIKVFCNLFFYSFYLYFSLNYLNLPHKQLVYLPIAY